MLTEALRNEFTNAFSVLEAAILSFAQDDWRRGRTPYVGPARAVAHVLQCAEFYTCRDKAVFTNLPKRVYKMSDQETPSQEQMIEYLALARTKTLAWLESMGDAGLAAACSEDPAISNLQHAIYALRHLQHHTGEVCAYQKQLGMEPADWQ